MHIMENPASCLYDILAEIYRISKKRPGEYKFKATWATVLEIEENDLDKIMRGIIRVHDLYNQTKNIVRSHEKLNTDQNNKYLKNIYNAIYTLNFQGNMNNFHKHMTSDTLIAFSYIRQAIDLIYEPHETLLNEEEKEDLVKNINKLVEDFVESDLPEDLKSTCTSGLANIKDSLIHYKIYGAKGLQSSISKATGDLYLIGNSTVEYKNHKNIKGFFEIIHRINTIFTTTESGIKLATIINTFLT